MDLSNWMRDLGEPLRSRPIIFIAIPGSHDSLSYSINKNSEVAPDAEKPLKILMNVCGPLARKFVLKWCVTQNLDINQQLMAGIRYFDLRVAPRGENRNIHFTHGLFGGRISDALRTVASFLKTHPGEVAVLDFQHFYAFTRGDHLGLVSDLHDSFGTGICVLPDDISKVTLNWMQRHAYRVIIIYRESTYANASGGYLWPSSRWPTPWPETMSKSTLVTFLDSHLKKRPSNSGYVSQCLLTPTQRTVIVYFWSSLRPRCAVPAASATVPWLRKQQSGVVNVVISDFVADNNKRFPKTVIAINKTESKDEKTS